MQEEFPVRLIDSHTLSSLPLEKPRWSIWLTSSKRRLPSRLLSNLPSPGVNFSIHNSHHSLQILEMRVRLVRLFNPHKNLNIIGSCLTPASFQLFHLSQHWNANVAHSSPNAFFFAFRDTLLHLVDPFYGDLYTIHATYANSLLSFDAMEGWPRNSERTGRGWKFQCPGCSWWKGTFINPPDAFPSNFVAIKRFSFLHSYLLGW